MGLLMKMKTRLLLFKDVVHMAGYYYIRIVLVILSLRKKDHSIWNYDYYSSISSSSSSSSLTSSSSSSSDSKLLVPQRFLIYTEIKLQFYRDWDMFF